jgi:hypothetical protein
VEARPRSAARSVALAALCAALAIGAAQPAEAARSLKLGLTDNLFMSANAGTRAQWLDRAVQAGATDVQLGGIWRAIAPADRPPGFDARNPAHPAYNWGTLDAAVSDARARGLAVTILVGQAPSWAEGANRRPSAPAGTWKPKPAALEDFGHAIASRYSGSFGPLPAVRQFQLWAEPNLSNYLNPQYKRKRPKSPSHYRRMLNAFNSGVNSANRRAKVITGGTAPYGEPPGGDRMRPLAFWRGVFCLTGTPCRRKARFDVLAHHPITTSGGPNRSAIHPDDVATPDLHNLRALLRRAERANTISGGRHPLWATEFWWESNPPDTCTGVKARKHARYIAEALYLYWKQGASLAVNFLLRDTPYNGSDCGRQTFQTGLYFADGSPKPALQAFRFPFVADRLSKRKARLWARTPVAGKLVIERRRGGDWRRIAGKQLAQGKVFAKSRRIRGNAKLRARVGGQTSSVWRLR